LEIDHGTQNGPDMSRLEKRIVVVGGGVIGVCCAYYLAKCGAAVTLLERDEVGQGASFGNAGTIAPGHGPINRPGRVLQAVRSLRDELSPLYVAPRWDPALARWLWRFSRKCTEEHVEHCLSVLGPMGHTTRELFQRLVEEESLDCGYRQAGYYEVFRTQSALDNAWREAELQRAHGYHPEALEGPAMREREAAVNRGVVGAVFFPEAGTVNPHRFVLAMAERAQAYGASVVTGADVAEILIVNGAVSGVRTTAREEVACDLVLIAAGAYTPRLTRNLGITLPLQPAKGYHRDRDPEKGGAPPLRNTVMLGEKSVFCTPMDGFVRFAGTLEFSGVNHEIRQPRLEQLTNAARFYLDGMADQAALSEWCGLRPCVSDGLPVIGPVPGLVGLFLATGHGMLGLTLGPVTGRLVADCMLDGKPDPLLNALGVGRF
jgi:D-amino-acid dehydrogenase